jgi:oligoribonuclease (3'-5' exoribonuclease)
MQVQNEQDLVDRGVRAEELLQNETFSLAVKDIVDFHLNTFLTSTPEDDKLREQAYYQSNAVQQVIGVLQQWVAIKESIMSNNSVEE